MSYYHQPYTFLLALSKIEDASKIDAAIHDKKLGYQKLGDTVYLAFLFETPAEVYSKLKVELGLTGEIHWIQLPHAEITK
jgi:hypothetical protein